MPRKASLAEKVRTIRETQSNGDIYIYERKTIYDPNLKYNRCLGKTLIGKIPKGSSEIIETRPKRRDQSTLLETAEKTITASKRRVGMLDIIAHVEEKSGVARQLNKAIPDDIGLRQKTQTLSWYCFAMDDNTWPGIHNWTTRYAGLLPYRHTPISQDMYHDVFVYLGMHEEIKQSTQEAKDKLKAAENSLAKAKADKEAADKKAADEAAAAAATKAPQIGCTKKEKEVKAPSRSCRLRVPLISRRHQ